MKKLLRTIAFMLGISLVPLCLSSALLNAQQVNEDQRAYQTGYQNGVNDARRNKPMNMQTGDWHGNRLNEYQRGYQEGYKSAAHYDEHHEAAVGAYSHDPESQKAFDSGYQNGVRDREHHKEMNDNSGDWHGERLEAYRKGYEEGYRGAPRP